MNPYDHARSSAHIHGGCWADYHAIHAWFDLAKAAHCHFTHRALRHHDRGVVEAITVFGPAIRNADGAEVPVEAIARQHIEEDCQGEVPAASDWLLDFDMPDWFLRELPMAEDLADISARRFGGEAAAYLPLHRWYLETREWAGSLAHLLFRHQSFGTYEAETRFGPALDNGGAGVPTRVVSERHVRSVLGRIPAACDLLRRIKGQRWMLQATSPARLGLT
jgi:hypothetical protein